MQIVELQYNINVGSVKLSSFLKEKKSNIVKNKKHMKLKNYFTKL